MSGESKEKMTRREFVSSVAAGAATTGLMIIKPQLARGTAANSHLAVGLLGCGGRGTDDATNIAMHTPARVVALADMFQDRLDKAKAHFDGIAQQKGYPGIESRRMFRGPDSYHQIANSKDVDAVVIATPPYFHPIHLAGVVEAGKHVYCEKPVAVDVDGCRNVVEIGKKTEGRLSLDVGFELRKAPPYIELRRRMQAGALGRMACAAAHYYAPFPRLPAYPGKSKDYIRLRNWYYDRVLSGDTIVEQNIHVMDLFNWMLNDHPLKATATGGRQVRTDWGNVYGHYNTIFYYPDEVSIGFNSTQIDKGLWDVGGKFFGAKGDSVWAYSGPVAIFGDEAWTWNPAQNGPSSSKGFSASGHFSNNLAQADPDKLGSFIESITSGKFHNQAAQGTESTLSAMLAREAAYLGRDLTWDELNSMDMKWDLGMNLNQFA